MNAEKYFQKNGFIWGIGNFNSMNGQYLIRFDDWKMFEYWAKDSNNVWCSKSTAEWWQKEFVG